VPAEPAAAAVKEMPVPERVPPATAAAADKPQAAVFEPAVTASRVKPEIRPEETKPEETEVSDTRPEAAVVATEQPPAGRETTGLAAGEAPQEVIQEAARKPKVDPGELELRE
jgi:hypothetical protein